MIRIAENPFYVLGVRPDATRAEVERAGQRLLAMLELGLSAADSYATPVGERERTADLVRRALAELRDPDRRLVHELWASLPSEAAVADGEREGDEDARPAAWEGAHAALGWRRR